MQSSFYECFLSVIYVSELTTVRSVFDDLTVTSQRFQQEGILKHFQRKLGKEKKSKLGRINCAVLLQQTVGLNRNEDWGL